MNSLIPSVSRCWPDVDSNMAIRSGAPSLSIGVSSLVFWRVAILSVGFDVQEGGRPLPWILPAAEVFIFLVGVLAVFGPARRALSADPVETLRQS